MKSAMGRLYQPVSACLATQGMLLLAVPGWLSLMTCGAGAADSRPNIILVLADDLGYETVGANGGQSYATPRLDSLASSGIRFRNAHAQPLCTPTRAQGLTGKYNVRNYSVFGTLRPGQVTFANLLQDNGYKTFAGGKWQLQGGYDGPTGFGFDEYFLWQLNRRPQRYYAPGFEAHIPADGLNRAQINYPAGMYGPDLVHQKIIEFIGRHPAEPFFVYYPMLLTHSPFTPSPDHPDYDPTSTNELNNTVYFGSMVEYMDKLIGQLVDRLEQLGLRQKTLILFTGDNGTGTGVTSMFNGYPVQGGKGKTTEAGTHVPFIANWPGTIPPSQVCDDLLDSSDLLPTICQAAGVAIPSGLDGRSFLPQMLGQPGTPREWTYCWFKPQNGTEADVKEFARTLRFKLYASGLFYDVANDVFEQSPLETDSLSPEAQAAFSLLTNALADFNDARLDRALAPQPNPALWNSPPTFRGLGSIAMTASVGADINGPAEYQFRNVTLSRDSAWQLSPTYADSGLGDASTYAYQVRMQDLLGNTTEWSELRSATTPSSPNPQVVIIEQPSTDGNAAAQNLGQSFTALAAHEGWFLDAITFYAVTNANGASTAFLSLYDGFTNRTSRGQVLSVSANAVLNPRTQGSPMTWKFTNVVLRGGATYFAAVSDSSAGALSAGQGVPAQRMLINVYSGGERLNESGRSPDVDLRFRITARRYPSDYGQWTLGIPPGAPNGFSESVSPGGMLNGWKYFFGLGPSANDPSRWPLISAGRYSFRLDPKVTDVSWRIRCTPALSAAPASWQIIEPSHPDLLYDPVTGEVQFPPPVSPKGFFLLEIGLKD